MVTAVGVVDELAGGSVIDPVGIPVPPRSRRTRGRRPYWLGRVSWWSGEGESVAGDTEVARDRSFVEPSCAYLAPTRRPVRADLHSVEA